MKSKKLAVVFVAVLLVFTLSACNSASFMSAGQAKKIAAEYSDPEVTMELQYKLNDRTVTLELQYKLLIEKAPITVLNFIRLVRDGYYCSAKTEDGKTETFNTIIDGRISSSTNAWIGGRYGVSKLTEGEETTTTYKVMPSLGYTVKGEFVSNNYVLDKESKDADNEDITDGNAKISFFSLAMFHPASADEFDSASHAFFFNISTETKENYKNYAVFAELLHCKAYVGEGEDKTLISDGETVPSVIRADFANSEMTTTTTSTQVKDEEGLTTTPTLFKNPIVITSMKMTDDNDYSKLPVNYVIKTK